MRVKRRKDWSFFRLLTRIPLFDIREPEIFIDATRTAR